jgi:hypothetical protein
MRRLNSPTRAKRSATVPPTRPSAASSLFSGTIRTVISPLFDFIRLIRMAK